MSDRAPLIDGFLKGTPWKSWARSAIPADASSRQYHRLTSGGESAILMDAPPDAGEDTRPFARLALHLKGQGLCAPDILQHDPERGFMLLSDLGPNDVGRWLQRNPGAQSTVYLAATDVLVRLNTVETPDGLITMTPQVGADMIGIVSEYSGNADTADLRSAMKEALETYAPKPTTLALRDFHAENLIWRAEYVGLDRVGLLDFQDAFIAPPGYDLASLLRDARRDVPEAIVREATDYFIAQIGAKQDFRIALACLGVQRNLRILGVFARLAKTKGKLRYLSFMPRVWENIMRDLQNPALGDLRQAVFDTLPAPTPLLLEGLRK